MPRRRSQRPRKVLNTSLPINTATSKRFVRKPATDGAVGGNDPWRGLGDFGHADHADVVRVVDDLDAGRGQPRAAGAGKQRARIAAAQLCHEARADNVARQFAGADEHPRHVHAATSIICPFNGLATPERRAQAGHGIDLLGIVTRVVPERSSAGHRPIADSHVAHRQAVVHWRRRPRAACGIRTQRTYPSMPHHVGGRGMDGRAGARSFCRRSSGRPALDERWPSRPAAVDPRVRHGDSCASHPDVRRGRRSARTRAERDPEPCDAIVVPRGAGRAAGRRAPGVVGRAVARGPAPCGGGISRGRRGTRRPQRPSGVRPAGFCDGETLGRAIARGVFRLAQRPADRGQSVSIAAVEAVGSGALGACHRRAVDPRPRRVEPEVPVRRARTRRLPTRPHGVRWI